MPNATRDYKVTITGIGNPPQHVFYVLKNGTQQLEVDHEVMSFESMQARLDLVKLLMNHMKTFGDSMIQIEKL